MKKELEHIKKGRIIIGSVHDPYQNLEKKFQLTRTILETLKGIRVSLSHSYKIAFNP